MSSVVRFRTAVFCFLLFAASTAARADVVLFIEDPINFLGHLSSTGHAAVMFDRLCSDDHTHMRPCREGETGAVVSKYQGTEHKWLAVSPGAYLYAADSIAEVPTSATVQDVAFLRAAYEREHRASFAQDPAQDIWVQLIGASYRRRITAIRVNTTDAEDLRAMRWLNENRGDDHFNFFFANCSDFVRQLLNVLYPGSVRRDFVFDAGMTTPKQLASSLHHYARHHPELEYEVGVLPQVPGTTSRSGHTYGVTQSFARTKLYLYPLAILQPVGIGSVIAVGFCDHRYSAHAEMPVASVTFFQPAPDGVIKSGD